MHQAAIEDLEETALDEGACPEVTCLLGSQEAACLEACLGQVVLHLGLLRAAEGRPDPQMPCLAVHALGGVYLLVASASLYDCLGASWSVPEDQVMAEHVAWPDQEMVVEHQLAVVLP